MEQVRTLARFLDDIQPPPHEQLSTMQERIQVVFGTFWNTTKTSSTSHVHQLLGITRAVLQHTETGIRLMMGIDPVEDENEALTNVGRALLCIEKHDVRMLLNALRIPRSNQRAMRKDTDKLADSFSKKKKVIVRGWTRIQTAFASHLVELRDAIPVAIYQELTRIDCDVPFDEEKTEPLEKAPKKRSRDPPSEEEERSTAHTESSTPPKRGR